MEKPQHYVDNAKLLEELTKHRVLMLEAKEQDKPPPRLSNYIGECIMLIANHQANAHNFANYPFRDEMIGDAIENCCMYVHNFDPAISKYPFTYISRIVYWAFVRRIVKEKNYLYLKHKMVERFMTFNDGIEQSEFNENPEQALFENEHMNDFVKGFEEMLDKKEKKKKGKKEKHIPNAFEDENEVIENKENEND